MRGPSQPRHFTAFVRTVDTDTGAFARRSSTMEAQRTLFDWHHRFLIGCLGLLKRFISQPCFLRGGCFRIPSTSLRMLSAEHTCSANALISLQKLFLYCHNLHRLLRNMHEDVQRNLVLCVITGDIITRFVPSFMPQLLRCTANHVVL